jgi:hypothetical protein
METVDQQLDRLELQMRNELQFQLSVHVPRRYWEHMNELDNATNENIRATLRDVFGPWITIYRHTIVETILVQCRDILVQVVWAAMNVPFPQDFDAHIQSVIRNAHYVYVQLIYAPLRTEMIMANHTVEIIQRTWRRSIADPSYLVCRRRLLSEFETFPQVGRPFGQV